jgi:hypothetical protein
MIASSTKRVAAIQSCYIPWRGYFDFIASVDVFVIYDDIQYSTGSWRNRNQVKLPSGLKWITVPVTHKLGMRIDEVKVGSGPKPWKESHRSLLTQSLSTAPFFKDALELWNQCVESNDEYLSQLNVRLLRAACHYLQITTPLIFSSELNLTGAKTDRLLQMLSALKATHYLSGPAAKDYLDEAAFPKNAITLEYKSYDYAPYPQQWGEFAGAVSILDLIANTGPDARLHLKSRTPDVVVPA